MIGTKILSQQISREKEFFFKNKAIGKYFISLPYLNVIKNSLSRDTSCDSIFVPITELTGEFVLL